MDTADFIKQCLKDFNYPNIHSLSDNEIANIFQRSNRLFLIFWLFKQFNNNFDTIIEDAKNKELLGEFVSRYGFCSVNEKEKFIESELSSEAQLNILYKIFKFLLDISFEKKNNLQLEIISNYDVKNLLNMNTNLFPVYGPIQKLSTEERNEKCREYYKEIEELKTIITETQPNDEKQIINQSSLDTDLYNKLNEILQGFDDTCVSLKKNINGMRKDKNNVDDNNIIFNKQSSKLFKECNENLTVVSEFIKSVNIITSFDNSENARNFNCAVSDHDVHAIITELLQQIKEIFRI